MRLIDCFTSSVFVWQNDTTSYFSDSLNSKVWSMLYHGPVGASSREKHYFMFSSTLSAVLLLLLLLFFHHKICVSIIFNSFLDEASNFRYRILTNQKQKFVVENCQWKCMSQYFLNWNIHCAYYVGLTSFGIKTTCKTTVITLFCILLLNWDIRLPSLCGFHVSHRKIRSNTRINTLFQVTTTRLRYHITFTIAVVIQATEK